MPKGSMDRSWVGVITGWDSMEKTITLLTGTQTPSPSVFQPIASCYTDYTILAPYNKNYRVNLPLFIWRGNKTLSDFRTCRSDKTFV
jgi:hypothetical protein